MVSSRNSVSIGHDIVDLSRREPALHDRFLSRVFSESEQRRVKSSPRDLWTHWAAKEAAYKALRRIISDTIFSPRRFVFDPRSETVTYGDIVVPCKVAGATDYVMVVCSTNIEQLYSAELSVWTEKAEVENLSIAVRELARKNISKKLEVDPKRITFAKSTKRGLEKVPVLLIDGLEQEHLISFSHHGNFVSCCILFSDRL